MKTQIDYVGIFLSNNALYPFLMIIDHRSNNQSIQGRIIDCLGESTFEGVLENKTITFTKRYKEPKSPRALKNDIYYTGTKENDNFEGIYKSTSQREGEKPHYVSGSFKLEKHHYSKVLDILVKESLFVERTPTRIFDKKWTKEHLVHLLNIVWD